MLIFWITEKLDNESKRQWQLAHPGTDLLHWQDLMKFLDSRSRALELDKEYSQAQTSNTNNSKQDRRIQSYSTVNVRISKACQFLIEQNSLKLNNYVSIVCNLVMEWVPVPLGIPAKSV